MKPSIGCILGLCLLVPLPLTAGEAVPAGQAQIELTFAPLVRRAAPAVVNIYASHRIVERALPPLFDDPFFRHFFGDGAPGGARRERVENALGSGVLVTPDGLVVTNHHVIAGADSIRIVLGDRTEYAADVVLSDERTDLALLRIRDAGDRDLPYLAIGDSDGLEVGDLVLAIGNPFGVGQTVTSGIVSAVARTSVGISDYDFFIQTDAAINPGNSGGALIDMKGQLIGINSAIYSRTGGSIGIGFAIPAGMLRPLLHAAATGGPVLRPWLGADGQPVDAALAEAAGLDRPAGMLVTAVDPRGPAAEAGLAVGDVVTDVDGRTVDDPEALRYRLATLDIGAVATIGVRRDGETLSLALPVRTAPEDPPRDLATLGGATPLAGAEVANLSPALADELRIDGPREGVIVTAIARGSPADRLGLRPGDIVLSIDGTAIDSVAALRAAVAEPRRAWHIGIRRDGRTLETTVTG
jgi:Do/DeqQ family serine protease